MITHLRNDQNETRSPGDTGERPRPSRGLFSLPNVTTLGSSAGVGESLGERPF
jgi:hypothetical protein